MQNSGLVASSGGGLHNFNINIQYDNNNNNKLVFCSFYDKIQCIFILDENDKFLNICAPEGLELIREDNKIREFNKQVSRDYGHHKYEYCTNDLENNRNNGFSHSSVIGAFYGSFPCFKAYIRIANNMFFLEKKTFYVYEESILYKYIPDYFKTEDESIESNESNEVNNSVSNIDLSINFSFPEYIEDNTNKYLIVKNLINNYH